MTKQTPTSNWQSNVRELVLSEISTERKNALNRLIRYIQGHLDNNNPIHLNFICTHNSRRSHLSQVWAQAMAEYHNVPSVNCYSGGTEVTAVHPMIIRVLLDAGFEIGQCDESVNPTYELKISDKVTLNLFSKTYDHETNPSAQFAAVMTCSEADQNCPVILGAKRISLPYNDPKKFDGTPLQNTKYKERSAEIATEMAYVFSNIQK